MARALAPSCPIWPLGPRPRVASDLFVPDKTLNSELGRTSRTELKIWCTYTKRRGRIARKTDPARAPGPSRRPPVPGPGLGPRVPGRGHRPRALGPGLGLGSGAHRGISGPGGVMDGHGGLYGVMGGSWGRCFLLGRAKILNSELNVLGNLEREAC